MNTINKLYEDACIANSCNDLLFAMYEILGHETGNLTIVSPCWKPSKVFAHQDVEIEIVSEHTSFSSYRIRFSDSNQWFSWIYCSPGSGNIMDVCLSLFNADTKHMLFVGSAGSMDDQIHVGEIVLAECAETIIPSMAILDSKGLNDKHFDTVFSNKNSVYTCLSNYGKLGTLPLKQVKVLSTPSIIGEYTHKIKFRMRKIQCIEMEVYTFLYLTSKLRKQGTAILCISDSLNSNHGLLNRDEYTRKDYLDGREKLLPQIIHYVANLLE